ncbi:tRNA (cytidine(34)-2'-O)-methyltransferase [Radicibacter daui]|uniref:tRNA (cytidine(34)-2'-O)-methyltransferase n=1 Tax=Radicibacter daui TaxID=3064829 RepID=UPI00404705B9
MPNCIPSDDPFPAAPDPVDLPHRTAGTAAVFAGEAPLRHGGLAERRQVAGAPVRLALFEPDIPQNTGTLMRTAACLDVALDLVEPCGFLLDDKRLRRAAMDYWEHLDLARHRSFASFERWRRAAGHRLVLVETDGAVPHHHFTFQRGDILMMGRESAGVTPQVYAAAEASVFIPQRAELRSLNVAVAGAMLLGEALRQLGGFAEAGAAG